MTQPLHIKTYFSTTVEAALALARKELGPEALLMNSRQTPPEVRHLGRYEVVFAGAQGFGRASRPEPEFEPGGYRRKLLEEGVDPSLIETLLQPQPASLKTVLSRMESIVKADPSLGGTVALAGPPGSGKTLTLIKLAMRYGVALRVPVRIFTVGDSRVGAASALRSYASSLGIGLQSCDSIPMLEQALDCPAGAKTLTLIDTPGYGRHEMSGAYELARSLTARRIDVHLVLRSEAKTAELLSAVERYRIFKPAKLIFTGIDEAESLGNVFSVAGLSGRPVSFLCCGQKAPEDLEPASARRLIDMVLKGGGASSQVAA